MNEDFKTPTNGNHREGHEGDENFVEMIENYRKNWKICKLHLSLETEY